MMINQSLRHKVKLFFLLGLAAASATGIAAVVAQLNAPVTTVKIDGNMEPEQQAQIRKLLTSELSQGFVGMDLKNLVGNLNKVSWVRSAEARREWPSTLHLTLQRQALVARWNDQGYLNNSGDIVSGGRKPVEGLPRFECRNADGERAMYIYQMLNQISKPVGLTITSLVENDLGEWNLQFDTGMMLALGSEQLLPRMERFLVVYREQLAGQVDTVDSVDARYVNGIAVQWVGGLSHQDEPLIASNGITSGGKSNGN